MLNQRLAQKLQQKLSPQQIQLMKLLQVPTANLEQRIKEELEANPALESGLDTEEDADDNQLDQEDEKVENEDTEVEEEFDLGEFLADDDEIPDYKTRLKSDPNEEEKSTPVRVYSSFHESLEEQLNLLSLPEKDFILAKQIIGSIGDDGYMRRDLEALVDDLAFSQNVMTTPEELGKVLKIIQGFEPIGIGARDLKECLLIQLYHKKEKEKSLSILFIIQLAIDIMEKKFDEFAKKHYEKLQTYFEVDEDTLRETLEMILKLNPKPGGGYEGGPKVHQNIIPDFIVTLSNGELELRLNSRNAPDLRISGAFKEMLKDYSAQKKTDKEKKDALVFIKQKIDSAKWFIDAIKSRQHTLYTTMKTIMEIQEAFFFTGDDTDLKPMILKDVAEKIQMDISTVSRVANSKFVETEFGTFSLKHFFSESMTSDTGEEVSTKEIKSILSDLVDGENKKKPHSDQKLMEELKEKGYPIARRTVAKYREQLNIPVARLRKEL